MLPFSKLHFLPPKNIGQPDGIFAGTSLKEGRNTQLYPGNKTNEDALRSKTLSARLR